MTDTARSVLMITPDTELFAAVDQALAGLPGISVRGEATTLPRLNGKAASLAAGTDVIIFETSDDAAADLEAVGALAAGHRGEGIVVALTADDTPLSHLRALTAAGVDEVLPTPLARSEIVTHLKQLERRAVASRLHLKEKTGRLIAVAQARGGIGATTVAVNLAGELIGRRGTFRRHERHSVALVDLDLQFGSVGTFLDLAEQDVLHRIALDGAIPDETFLEQSMSHVSDGLSVLAAPSSFMPLDSISPEQVAAIIDALRAANEYVVVDLPRALVGWIEPVLKRADELIIVTDTSVPAIRNCRRLIEFFTADNPALEVRVVVNHETRARFGSALQREAAKALDRRIEHWLPHDPVRARAAVDRGKPLAAVAPRSRLARAMQKLARATATETPHVADARRREE